MAKRRIRDERGMSWDVWEVLPTDMPGRSGYDRRSEARGETATDRGTLLDPELASGWLCFQAGAERRRFAPIPPGWFELPDTVLRVMLDIATAVSTPSSAPPRTPAD